MHFIMSTFPNLVAILFPMNYLFRSFTDFLIGLFFLSFSVYGFVWNLNFLMIFHLRHTLKIVSVAFLLTLIMIVLS